MHVTFLRRCFPQRHLKPSNPLRSLKSHSKPHLQRLHTSIYTPTNYNNNNKNTTNNNKTLNHLRSHTYRQFCTTANPNDKYSEFRHPLITRYASKNMRSIWSEREKFATWRRLWTALAKAQMELGVPGITDAMIKEMEKNIYNIDFDLASANERELRHDVMAHIHTFADCLTKNNSAVTKDAAKIIHLGATSCYVQDNSDLYLMKRSSDVILTKLLRLIKILRDFSIQYKDLPCLGFTHLQPAQLTTVGKRSSLWLQDFYFDFLHFSTIINNNLLLRGAKGTTGTQASFLKVFNGDSGKVDEMERKIVDYLGFSDSSNGKNSDKLLYLTGQTYTRKIDYLLLSGLSGIAQTVHKFGTDLRLLSSFGEIEEPFENKQVGSSAMAYKRNPMRSERVCSIARYLINLSNNTSDTHAIQWLERSLDDSANRRMVLPESFLSCDAILDLCFNILDGINVYDSVINKHINEEIAFMATENILMHSVKNGGNRQDLHEIIRNYSVNVMKEYKEEGSMLNNRSDRLLEYIKNDKIFSQYISNSEIDGIVNDKDGFIGRAPEQVTRFVDEVIDPLLQENEALLNNTNIDYQNVSV